MELTVCLVFVAVCFVTAIIPLIALAREKYGKMEPFTNPKE